MRTQHSVLRTQSFPLSVSDPHEDLLRAACRDLEATLVHLSQELRLLGLRAERPGALSLEARTDVIARLRVVTGFLEACCQLLARMEC
jgi:hypothetical protein